MTDQPNSSPAAPQPRATRLILAAFICAVGFAFLVISLSALKPNWFGPPFAASSPFMVIGCFGLAIGLLFRAENRPPPRHPHLTRSAATVSPAPPGVPPPPPITMVQGGPSHSVAARQPWMSRWSYHVYALIFVLLGALGLYLMCERLISAPIYDQYALSLGGGSPPADSVLFWWVKRDQDGIPAGALPMFLGSLLAIGFGVWFPKIALAASQGTLGAVEKFVAPLLSLALVGIGATQQADQNRAEMDRTLTQQGLPASLRLSSDQKIDQKLYAMDGSRMSDASIDMLERRVEVLEEKLANPVTPTPDPQVLKEITQLESELQNVQIKIYTLKGQTGGPAVPDLTAITKGLEALNQTGQDSLSAYRTQGAGACALMAVEYGQLNSQTPLVLKATAADLRSRARRNGFQRFAAWATGTPRPNDGTQLDTIAANLARTQMTLKQTIEQACPPGTIAASNVAVASGLGAQGR